MSDTLSTQESVRLCELERIIQKGKDTFVEVGTALSEIRDSRIYRATFKTFEEYCKERWDFNRDYVNKIIAASSVISNLDTMVSKPTNERQARPLAQLPADKQPAAWERAQEIAKEESKPVAARHVEAAVLEVMPKEEPETLVVDESKTTRRSPMKVVENCGMDKWEYAKSYLDQINKNDESREKALKACMEYCRKRLAANK